MGSHSSIVTSNKVELMKTDYFYHKADNVISNHVVIQTFFNSIMQLSNHPVIQPCSQVTV